MNRSNNTLSIYIISIIALVFSKELYVMNEESIILLSFLLFLLSILGTLRNVFAAEFDSQSEQILMEFNELKETRIKTLLSLMDSYANLKESLHLGHSALEYVLGNIGERAKDKRNYLIQTLRVISTKMVMNFSRHESKLIRETQEEIGLKFASDFSSTLSAKSMASVTSNAVNVLGKL